jgi:antitoxin CptB
MMATHIVPDESNSSDREVRCRRVLFQCWHRGTQESDFILGGFADAYLTDFDSAQLGRFEALLECTDPDLFDWIIGGFDAPEEHDHDVIHLLRAFALRRTRKTNTN